MQISAFGIEGGGVIAVRAQASNPGATPCQSLLCEPSHNTPFPECLQPQKKTLPSFSAVCLTGAKSLPLWLPSQNGWFDDWPHEHQK